MADERNGLTVADVAALSGGGMGGFGNGFEGLIYLAVIASMFGGGFGFGGFGNGGAAMLGLGNMATQNDVQRGFDNQNLQAQTRDLMNAVNAQGAAGIAATNQTFHDTLATTQNLYNELARDVASVAVGQANLLANQNDCCKQTQLMIQQASADNALQMAQMEARINAKMDANEITALRDQVQKLQMDQATAGMLRFPNSWSYGAGPFPPIFGCGCNANM